MQGRLGKKPLARGEVGKDGESMCLREGGGLKRGGDEFEGH
jgi:hypothetical protein